MEGFPVLRRFDNLGKQLQINFKIKITHSSSLDYRSYVETCGKFGKTIISVGSGKAALESWTLLAIPDLDIICVDPNPKNYDDEIATVKIQPLFSSTQELCEKFPEMKGNCSVMLIRPQTSGSTDITNYDIEAIHLLEPLVILVLYGADGSDGSCALHDFLSLHGCPSFSKSDTSHTNNSTFAGFPRYWSRTIRFTEICQPPTMVRVSTCALLIRDDSGLTFPDNIIEGEQNPNAPSDAEVVRLLKESYAFTAMKVLGGENTELLRLFLEMMGNEEIK